MTKHVNRVLSLILVLVLMISTIPLTAMPAMAAEGTAEGIYVEENGVEASSTISLRTGKISDNAPSRGGYRFQKAVVRSFDGNGLIGEEEIAYITKSGEDTLYSLDSVTSAKLKATQKIVLIYSTAYSVKYVVNTKNEVGGASSEEGGYFTNNPVSIESKNDFQFALITNPYYTFDSLEIVNSSGAKVNFTADVVSSNKRLIKVNKSLIAANLTVTATFTKGRSFQVYEDDFTNSNICLDCSMQIPYNQNAGITKIEEASSHGYNRKGFNVPAGENITFLVHSHPFDAGPVAVTKRLFYPAWMTINGESIYLPHGNSYDTKFVINTTLKNGSKVSVNYHGLQRDLHPESQYSQLRDVVTYYVTLTNVQGDVAVDSYFMNYTDKGPEIVVNNLTGIENMGASLETVGTNITGKHILHYSLQELDMTKRPVDDPPVFVLNRNTTLLTQWEPSMNIYLYDVKPGYNPYTVFIGRSGTPYKNRDPVTGLETPEYRGKTQDVIDYVNGLSSEYIRNWDNEGIINPPADIFFSQWMKAAQAGKPYEYAVYYPLYMMEYSQALYIFANAYQYNVKYELNGGSVNEDAMKLNETINYLVTPTYLVDQSDYSVEAGSNYFFTPHTVPTRAGYTFEGWQVKNDTNGTKFGTKSNNSRVDITDDLVSEKYTEYLLNSKGEPDTDAGNSIVLQAQWSQGGSGTTSSTYKVEYYYESPTGSAINGVTNGKKYSKYYSEEKTGIVGNTYQLTTMPMNPDPELYQLNTKDSKLSISPLVASTDSQAANNVMYVLFDSASSRLYYDVNGGRSGTEPVDLVNHEPGSVVQLSSQKPLHDPINGEKVVFIGWTKARDTNVYGTKTGEPKGPPATITQVTFPSIRESVTVYASWGYDRNNNDIPDILEEHEVNYKSASSFVSTSILPETVMAKANEVVTLDSGKSMSRAEYDNSKILFYGWTTNPEDKDETLDIGDTTKGEIVKQVTMQLENIYLYAVWAFDRNDNGIPDVDETAVTVTMNLNGGTDPQGTVKTSTKLVRGGKFTMPNGEALKHEADSNGIPVLFVGWTKAPAITKNLTKDDTAMLSQMVDGIQTINADTTFYAAWGLDENKNGIPDVKEGERYSLTYNLNGGTNGPTGTNNHLSGDTVTLKDTPKPTRGDTNPKVAFMGWSASQDSYVYKANDTVPSSLIKTVTFRSSNLTVYAVYGVDLNENGIADIFENTYKLTYDVTTGTGNVVDNNLYPEGMRVTLKQGSELSGMSHGRAADGRAVAFVGWSSTRNDKLFTANDTYPPAGLVENVVMNNNTTVYALWGYDTNNNGIPDILEPNKYTLSYNLNGGSPAINDDNKYVSEQIVTLSTAKPTRGRVNGTPVAFVGWSKNDNGTTRIYGGEETEVLATIITTVTFVDANITAHAVWGADLNENGIADVLENATLELRVNPNGGSFSGSTGVTVYGLYKPGAKVTLSSIGKPTYSGKINNKTVVFMGWSKTQFPGVLTANDASPDEHLIDTVNFIAGNETIYAVWATSTNGTDPDPNQPKYKLRYNINTGDGTVPTDSNNYVPTEVVTLSTQTSGMSHARTSEGYKVLYMGWATTAYPVLTANDSPPSIVTSVTFQNKDIDVYATWGVDANNNDIPDVLETDRGTMRYNPNGGTGTVPVDNNQYIIDHVLKLPDKGNLRHADNDGSAVLFIGWSKQAASILEADGTMPADMIKPNGEYSVVAGVNNMYAVWGYDRNNNGIPDIEEDGRGTMKYNANGGTGAAPIDNTEYVVDRIIRLPTQGGLTHAHDDNVPVLFVGWSKEMPAILEGSGTLPADLVMAQGEYKVAQGVNNMNAVWGYDRNNNQIPDILENEKGKMVYNGNGGTGTAPVDNNQYVVKQTIKLPTQGGLTHAEDDGAPVLFAGWSKTRTTILEGNGTLPADFLKANENYTVASGTNTMYAVWGYDRNKNDIPDILESEKGTMRYGLNGGTGTVPTDSMEYAVGQVIKLPAKGNLTHADDDNSKVVFVGWSKETPAILDAGGTKPADLVRENGDYPVKSGVNNMNAVWGYDRNNNGIPDVDEDSFGTMRYDANGGSGAPTDNTEYVAGRVIKLPGKGNLTHADTDNSPVLFVGWTKQRVTAILERDSTLPTDLIRGGGEYKVAPGTNNMYAVWGYDRDKNEIPDVDEKDAKFPLHYDANGGNPAPTDTNEYAVNHRVNLKTAEEVKDSMKYPDTPDGHKVLFAGWTEVRIENVLTGNDDRPNYATSYTIKATRTDNRVYAVWGVDRNGNGIPDVNEDDRGNMIYDINGGTGTVPVDNSQYMVGEKITLPLQGNIAHAEDDGAPVLFVGWFEQKLNILEGTDTLPDGVKDAGYKDYEVAKGPNNMYVVWGYDRNKNNIPDVVENANLKVIYDANGGDANSVPAYDVAKAGETVTLKTTPKPTHAKSEDGYAIVFTGWSVTPYSKIHSANDTLPAMVTSVRMENANKTVYAVWSYDKDGNGNPDPLDEKANITYDPNGAQGTAIVVKEVIGASIPVPGSLFTFPGREFLGWNTAANGSGTSYKEGSRFTVTTNVTMYSQWTAGEPTHFDIVSESSDNGKISPLGTISVRKGTDQTFIFTPDEGYRIENVMVDGVNVFSGSGSSYTFTNVTEAHTIRVNYVEEDKNVVLPPESTGVGDMLIWEDHIQYVQGYPDTGFHVAENMTRAEVAQMFYNLLRNKNMEKNVNFTDVPDNGWYTVAVKTLASKNIIVGYEDATFRPDRPITRAEFVSIVTRFATKVPDISSLNFIDVKTSDWFYSAILRSVDYGWVMGYGDKTFRPHEHINRGEVISIVNRVLYRFPDKEFINRNIDSLTTFSYDLESSHWAYYEVIEAANGHDHENDAVTGAEIWIKLK